MSAKRRTMKLLVVREIFNDLRLPGGFHSVGNRLSPDGRLVEVSVNGKFPRHIPDGSQVGATITQRSDHLQWQWTHQGAPVGESVWMAA